MDEIVLLTNLALFILLAAACSIVFNKIKLPPLIGYIVAGIIIANIWTVTHESEDIVGILSDIGLVLLMFCIGLEINLKKIRKQGLFAIEVAVIQLPLMVLGGALAGMFLGFDMVQSICLGAIISGSSTAVVMAVLKSQKRLDKEHIEMLVLITIMEDIGQVIILSMITPIMASNNPAIDVNSLIVMIASILIFMIVSLLIGLRLIPRMINWVSDNVSDEILTVFSVGLAFGMALLSIYIGLSMAIGAFLMPMRDLFMAIFFISIGMEISLSSLVDNILMIVIFYLLFAVMKISTVFLAYWVGGETCRNGFLSATGLVAMGEFAFIIALEALEFGVVDNAFYTSVIGAALVSMVTLPFLTRYADRMWDGAVRRCPKPVYTACCNVNASRDRLYTRVLATSTKSRKTLYRSMTRTYINILLIILVQIVFHFITPMAVEWLTASFGGNDIIWSITMLFVNFAILLMPMYHLVNNVKFLDEMVISGARHIAKLEGQTEEAGTVYHRFLEVNTYLMMIVIDAVVIIVTPNSVGLWLHLVMLAVAVVVLFAYYYKKKRDNRAGRLPEPEDESEESEEDEH